MIVIEVLGYAFIVAVLSVIGYLFYKLFSAGFSALTKHDD